MSTLQNTVRLFTLTAFLRVPKGMLQNEIERERENQDEQRDQQHPLNSSRPPHAHTESPNPPRHE